jgi:hypothetical protein
MLLQINEETKIEDPRQYGSEVVNDLRKLLTAGGWAQPDPHRDSFYEIEGDGRAFYFHISPINGEVVLLAKWLSCAKEDCAMAAQHTA